MSGGQDMTIGWPEILAIIAAVVAIVGALVGIGIWVGRISANLGHLKDTADQDRENFNAVAKQDRESFKENADKDRAIVSDFMKEIREDIKTLLGRTATPTAVGTSPAQLTEFGEKIAEAIGAYDWAIDTAKSVSRDDALRDLRPFQVDAFCKGFVETQSTSGGIVQEKIERAVYEFGIDKDRASPVLHIPLREALLARKESL